jgi:hypothetical protein
VNFSEIELLMTQFIAEENLSLEVAASTSLMQLLFGAFILGTNY